MSATIFHSVFRNETETSVSPFVQFAFCVDLCLLITLIPKIMAFNNLYLKIIFAKPEAEAEKFARWGWSSGKESWGDCKGKKHEGVHSHLHTDHFGCTGVNVHFFSQVLEEWPCFVYFAGALHFYGLNEHRCPIRAMTVQKISKVVLLKYMLEFWHELESFAESAPSSLINPVLWLTLYTSCTVFLEMRKEFIMLRNQKDIFTNSRSPSILCTST